MLLGKGKITEEVVKLIMSCRHSGFNVHCGPRIQPGDEEAMENLARYVVRASFSQERMTYIPEEAKVVYRSKDGRNEKIFDALEWLAAMCSHVPNKGEQMVRYYGYYSYVYRGRRKKADQDGLLPLTLNLGIFKCSYRIHDFAVCLRIQTAICGRRFGRMPLLNQIRGSAVSRRASSSPSSVP